MKTMGHHFSFGSSLPAGKQALGFFGDVRVTNWHHSV
jgi:hypothetical protein